MRRFFVLSISLFIFLATSQTVTAVVNCPVYGGGKTECAPTTTGTPAATTTPTRTPTPTPANQSKGGLPVQSKPPAKTTPATGPEMLGLIALIPTAAAGIWLRKKSSR